MATFREDNRYLIFSTCFFGLYMLSVDSLVSRRWVRVFLGMWSKMPILVLPVYIGWDIRGLVFDDMHFLVRFSLFRKVFGMTGYFIKNVIFYVSRRRVEGLIDLWDDSFKENFYRDLDAIHRENNNKRNKKIVFTALALSVTCGFSYAVPNFFSKKKVFHHPTGIIYPHRSPEYELAAAFTFWAVLCAVSTVAYDCILAVFISHVRSKVEFLTEAIADIIDELKIDEEGRLLGRQTEVADLRLNYPERSPEQQGKNRFSTIDDNYFYAERQRNGEELKRNIENVDNKLRVWIVHHQQIISFLEELKKVYTSTTTFQLVYTVIYTGVTAVHVAQVKLSTIAFSIALVAVSNLSSLFLWCWLAGELRSIQIFTDGFSRAWFLYPKKIKKAFSIIVMRSMKPLTIYGAFIYSIDLATFFEILKLTYQFFAFIVNIVPDEVPSTN